MIKLGRTHSRAGAAIDALEDFLGLFRHIWSTYHPNKSNGLLPARLFSLMPLTHLYLRICYADTVPYEYVRIKNSLDSFPKSQTKL